MAAVGLGPFGGVLALSVGSIGFLGKMYTESIEAIDPQQVLAVRATGAPRLHVGTGADHGAGAVVTKDVAPYEIVVGVPAHPIRKRFPDQIIEKLLQVAWWEWDRETLETRFPDLMDLDRFIAKYA